MSKELIGKEPRVLRGLSAGRLFDVPFLRLAETIRTWQLGFVLLLGLLVVAFAAIVKLSIESRVEYHVIEVDTLGRVVYAGPARQFEDVEPLIVHELTEFIHDLRIVVRDPVALFEFRKRAYLHLDQSVRAKLDRHLEENDPREVAKRVSREISVHSVVALSVSSWQLQWSETDTAHTGGRVRKTAWTAVIEVDLKSKEIGLSARRENPLNLFVTALNWSRTSEEIL